MVCALKVSADNHSKSNRAQQKFSIIHGKLNCVHKILIFNAKNVDFFVSLLRYSNIIYSTIHCNNCTLILIQETKPGDWAACAWYRDKHSFGYQWCPRAALRVGDWKLLTGCPGYSHWIPPPNSSQDLNTKSYLIKETKKLFLFNVAEDPEERLELSSQYPEKVKELLSRLAEYNNTAVPVRYPKPDLAANPALHDGVWSPWDNSGDNDITA